MENNEFRPLRYKLSYVAFPRISHELWAGTWATIAQQTSKDCSSDHHLIKTLSSKRLTRWDEMGQILQVIFVPVLIFMVLQGVQLLSGLGCSQRNAATSWWDGDVALVLGKEECTAAIFLQSPLPFLSPLGLASFVRLRCQLKVVPVVQPI